MLKWIYSPPPISFESMHFIQICLNLEGLKDSLGPGGSDVLTLHHVGQIDGKHTAHIKTKRLYATLRKIKRLLVLCFLKKTSPIHIIHTHSKRKEKRNKNVMYAFKWYFYGFLYNTTFSENIHLDINSSTNVQNL